MTASALPVPSASAPPWQDRFSNVEGPGAPRVKFLELPGDGTYDAYVTYPELTYDDPALSARVNKVILGQVVNRRGQWQRYLASERQTDVRAFRVEACSVMYASTTLVSIGCDIYEFNGGAHGNKGTASLNLRLPELRPILLEKVVTPGPRTRQLLMGLCDSWLAKAGPHRDPPQPGASMQSEFGDVSSVRFNTFVMTELGLVFYFKDQLPHVNADAVVPSVDWSDLVQIVQPGIRGLASPDIPFVRAKAPYDPWDKRR